jgi:hypothetical protein
MKEDLKALGSLFLFSAAVIAFITTVVLVILFLVYAGSSKSCTDTGEKIGLESDYGLWTGCMVKVQNEWIPLDKWRVIDDR